MVRPLERSLQRVPARNQEGLYSSTAMQGSCLRDCAAFTRCSHRRRFLYAHIAYVHRIDRELRKETTKNIVGCRLYMHTHSHTHIHIQYTQTHLHIRTYMHVYIHKSVCYRYEACRQKLTSIINCDTLVNEDNSYIRM
uniref:Uncharacterized protein n=1 Tax=Trichogramma kaykai TaxID=54128 RepID=A0ABD2X020_9HYME